jgi:hypothetical protein
MMGCIRSSLKISSSDAPSDPAARDTVVMRMSRPHAKYLSHVWKTEEHNIREIRVHYYNLSEDDPTRKYLVDLLQALSRGVTHNTSAGQYKCEVQTLLIPLLKSKCAERGLEMKWIHFDRD